ncbi:lachesin-like isoform X2, partial [Dinothrombium tinctorium]
MHNALTEKIDLQISSLNNQIGVLNSTLDIAKQSLTKFIEDPSQNIEKADKSDFVKRFFYITNKIDTCAVPATVKTYPSSRNLTVKEGSDINLSCEPKGFPLPSVRWISPEEEEIGTDAKLLIHKSSRYDTGVYKCVVDNDVGPPLVARFNVQVEYEPKVVIHRRKVYTGLNQNITLKCDIEANPMGIIQWWKNETNIAFEGENISANNTFVTSSLPIYIQSMNDFGFYSCETVNKLGKSIDYAHIVASPPFNITITD